VLCVGYLICSYCFDDLANYYTSSAQDTIGIGLVFRSNQNA